MKAKWLNIDGTIRISNSSTPDIVELQEYVEGYVQIITTPGGDFIVNEEGSLVGLLINEEATKLLQAQSPNQATIPLRGNVVILSKS